MRLTVVTNVPSPYRAPLFAEIHRLLSEEGGELTVIYGARADVSQQWGVTEGTWRQRDRFLREKPLRLLGRTVYASPGVVRALRTSRPDCVVVGGYAPWTYAITTWCRATKVPYLLWSAETPDSAAVNGWRRLRRWPLISHASGFLAYGPAAKRYLLEVGASEDRVTVVGNGIDVDGFALQVEEARERRDDVRRDLGVTRPAILAVGPKNLDLLASVQRTLRGSADVVVVGAVDGATCFITPGRVEHSRMPEIYAAVDCVAHLSLYDRWPHAVNEAIAAGLPTVVSSLAGVPSDVVDGPGCALVRPELPAVVDAIRKALHVAASSGEAEREAIRARLRPWGVDRMAARFVASARASVR